jgi:hypothetical protein
MGSHASTWSLILPWSMGPQRGADGYRVHSLGCNDRRRELILNPPCGGELGYRRLDVRYATSSTLKRIKVRQAAKSRRYSSDPHDLSAARAKGGPWRVFIKTFIAHGQSGP